MVARGRGVVFARLFRSTLRRVLVRADGPVNVLRVTQVGKIVANIITEAFGVKLEIKQSVLYRSNNRIT